MQRRVPATIKKNEIPCTPSRAKRHTADQTILQHVALTAAGYFT
jgi:hypothetical protein